MLMYRRLAVLADVRPRRLAETVAQHGRPDALPTTRTMRPAALLAFLNPYPRRRPGPPTRAKNRRRVAQAQSPRGDGTGLSRAALKQAGRAAAAAAGAPAGAEPSGARSGH